MTEEQRGWSPSARFQVLVGVLLFAWLLAIVPSRGDFWPFSRFRMFSSAGKFSERVVVVEVPAPVRGESLTVVQESELPGKVFPLRRHNLNPHEISAVIRNKALPLGERDQRLLAKYLERVRRERLRRKGQEMAFVLYLAEEARAGSDSFDLRFVPVVVIDAKGVQALSPQPGKT